MQNAESERHSTALTAASAKKASSKPCRISNAAALERCAPAKSHPHRGISKKKKGTPQVMATLPEGSLELYGAFNIVKS